MWMGMVRCVYLKSVGRMSLERGTEGRVWRGARSGLGQECGEDATGIAMRGAIQVMGKESGACGDGWMVADDFGGALRLIRGSGKRWRVRMGNPGEL